MSTLSCLYLLIYPPFGDLFIFKFKLISGRLAGSFQGRIKMFPSILPLHGEANSHRRPPTLLHSHSVLFIYASEEQWLRKQGDAASTTHIRNRRGLKQATRPPSQGRVCRVWLRAGQTGLWITTVLKLKSQSAAVNLTQCLAAKASGRIQKEAEHDSHNDGIVGNISLPLPSCDVVLSPFR